MICVCGDKAGGGSLPQVEVDDNTSDAPQFKMKKKCKGKKR